MNVEEYKAILYKAIEELPEGSSSSINIIDKFKFIGIIDLLNNMYEKPRYDIRHSDFISDKLFINQNINNLWSYTFMPDLFQDCIFYNLNLNSLTKIPKDFLKNSIIERDLCLRSIEYWPIGFYPEVKGNIYLNNLKSKTLMRLLSDPKTRQLGYNLLKN